MTTSRVGATVLLHYEFDFVKLFFTKSFGGNKPAIVHRLILPQGDIFRLCKSATMPSLLKNMIEQQRNSDD